MIVGKIKSLCAERKITINQLEKEVGIGHNSIYGWNKNAPSVYTLYSVAKYFDKPMEFFLADKE